MKRLGPSTSPQIPVELNVSELKENVGARQVFPFSASEMQILQMPVESLYKKQQQFSAIRGS